MITLTTYATSNYRNNCVELCIESIQRQVKAQPERVRFYAPLIERTRRHPSWHKLVVLREAMDVTDSEWVVWLDADSVVVNSNFAAEAWLRGLPKQVNVVTAHDWYGICCCFIALRTCDWSRQFLSTLDFLGSLQRQDCCYEQGSFKWFFSTAAEHQHRLYLAPTDIISDATLLTQPSQWIQHISSSDTRAMQQIVLDGGLIGESTHGIPYPTL